jgi:hypothetical protein
MAARRTAIGTPMPIPTFAPVERPVELEVEAAVAVAGGDEVIGNWVMVDVIKLEEELVLDVLGVDIWLGIVWPYPSAQHVLSEHQEPSSHGTTGTSMAKH